MKRRSCWCFVVIKASQNGIAVSRRARDQCSRARTNASLLGFQPEEPPHHSPLQKDLSVPPSGHNGCTYIPNRSGAPCVIKGEGAFVDRLMAPPRRLLPDPMVPSSANLK
ncbi:hypothetical protein V6N13_045982 [Hibiscus sabdariffa]